MEKFQHTAARRRLPYICASAKAQGAVSTHSRPKAAASLFYFRLQYPRFQHTAARRRLPAAAKAVTAIARGFNTQPPEGGCNRAANRAANRAGFQHTAARRRLPTCSNSPLAELQFQHTAARRRLLDAHGEHEAATRFQHTAARRRLPARVTKDLLHELVSTHSRPKAAASAKPANMSSSLGFNTQPPEGGCLPDRPCPRSLWGFNTQPPEGGCSYLR